MNASSSPLPDPPADSARASSGPAPESALSADLLQRTRAAIDGVRPYIQADGGDIELVAIEDLVAHVRLRGACRGCPHAAMTLQMGVERQLQALVPELRGVVAVP